MSNPLRTSENYELFLYTLSKQFPAVRRSTVIFIRRGTALARVAGTLDFDYDIRLIVRERLVYPRLPVVIDGYGYASQPHPNALTLRSTQQVTRNVSPPNAKRECHH